MKAIISVAALFAFALSLDAQITATLNRLPDGSIEIRVRNNSAVSSTAFAIKVDQVTGSALVYFDPDTVYVDTAIDPALRALEPNQEHSFKPRLRSHGGGPGPLTQALSGERSRILKQVDLSEHTITTAGVFADGSTTGDAVLLTRLMLRRSNMLLAVETTLETLSDAGSRNVSRDQLIGQFKKLADSVRRGYLPQEQRIGLDLYQSIIGRLMNLPETKDGSPFPPTEFVTQETTRLRQQRIPLVESQPSLFSLADASPFKGK